MVDGGTGWAEAGVHKSVQLPTPREPPRFGASQVEDDAAPENEALAPDEGGANVPAEAELRLAETVWLREVLAALEVAVPSEEPLDGLEDTGAAVLTAPVADWTEVETLSVDGVLLPAPADAAFGPVLTHTPVSRSHWKSRLQSASEWHRGTGALTTHPAVKASAQATTQVQGVRELGCNTAVFPGNMVTQ